MSQHRIGNLRMMNPHEPDIQKIEKPLLSHEEGIRFFLENVSSSYLMVDRDLRVVLISDHAKQDIERFFGKPINYGSSILDFVPESRKQALIRLYHNVFEGKEQFSETELNDKGTKRIFTNSFKPAFNDTGEIVGTIICSREITHERESSQSLKALEERWRFALEGGKQGVWDWNIRSGDVYFSPACKRIYECSDSEMPDRIESWVSLVHPEDRMNIQRAVNDHLFSTYPYYESTYRIRTKDGLVKWILARGTIVDFDGEHRPTRMIGTHTDISEQVRTQDAVRASNERYQYVSLATSDIVWDWDIVEEAVTWSRNYSKILGWPLPSDKILSFRESFEKVHPDDRQALSASVDEAINDPHRKTWQHEFRIRKADGEYAFVIDRGSLIRNGQGKALRMIGAMQDITERKLNEIILSLEKRVFELSTRLNEPLENICEIILEGLQKIYPSAASAVYCLDENNNIKNLVVNRLPQTFVEQQRLMEIGPDTGSCGTAMYIREIVISPNIREDYRWAKFQDFAREFDLRSAWSFPVLQGSGKVLGCLSVYYNVPRSPTLEDIGILERIRNIIRVVMEHQWAVNAIKSANEKFDIVIRATHDLIWDWNLETNTIERDLFGLQKVFGMDENEPIKGIYQWLGRIHPEDQPHVEDSINDIAKSTTQETFDIEYRFLRDDGTYSYVYDRGIVLRNSSGKPVRMIGAAQDVTERKRLEHELLKNELDRQKAINQATVDTQEQERNEIGKELHDNVNQVLTTTKLYLELAQTNTELKDELIAKSSKNIVSVINEIRQLSRSLMDPSIGDLGLIDSIYDLIEGINLTKKMRVDFSGDKEIDEILNKNQKLTVFRIVQEALNNAIRHAQASQVSLVFKLRERFIEIIIEDNGVGFDPLKTKKGAGLKNIQNRIYLVNGSHEIESAPGQGSRITINFPIQRVH